MRLVIWGTAGFSLTATSCSVLLLGSVGVASASSSPTITISSPLNGGTYNYLQKVATNFNCLDASGSPSPVCETVPGSGTGPPDMYGHASGWPLFTYQSGSFNLIVFAISSDGQTASKSVPYTVIGGPPTAYITAPPGSLYYHGAHYYSLGQSVTVTFTCAVFGIPTGIATCQDMYGNTSNGSTPGTGVLDTSAVGGHTYTVTAISKDGLSNTATFYYRVVDNPVATVSGSNTYGSNATFTYTNSIGAVPSGTVSCTRVAGGAAITPALPVGVYTIDPTSCSGLGATGYVVAYTAAANSFVVKPRPLTITASDGQMTYGGTVPTITPIYSGLINGDQAPSTPPTCTSNATSSTPAGTYLLTTSCLGASDPNYSISYANGTLTVNQAPLVITASDGSMTYGGTVPAITPSYSVFVNGDTSASLTTEPICSTDATSFSPVGSYTTSCTGAVDPNYSISYVNGTLTETVPFAPGSGSFVIGDQESAVGTSVDFWGAQWWKNNPTSSGSRAPSFKGFAFNPSQPTCGATWSADPGNSTPPPQGPLPAYMAVIVTSTYSKSGAAISGDIAHIVIVKTDPGYDNPNPNAGHADTGTVVAQVC